MDGGDLLRAQLRAWFGLADFRPGQREAIEALLNKRDVLIVMPTGSGKSLVYQFAALALPGLTLVVSPLIALMKDQVDRLQAHGIAATFINSALSSDQQQERLEALRRGAYRLIYVAPERLRSRAFLETLAAVQVSLFAVDEAHCISQWGHDFRPDYLHLREVRALLGSPTTVALTATATVEVQDEIIAQLGMRDPVRIVTGFQRPNLVFRVRHTPSVEAKWRELQKVLRAAKGAGIIYVGTRRDAEQLAAMLASQFGDSIYLYHGGMDRYARTRAQEDFLNDPQGIMVATNAFGMGVDRPDVRFVVHYTMPGSLEAYYQEAGRAGRDGKLAQCVLLYDPRDRQLHEWFIEHDVPSRAALQNLHRVLTRFALGDEVVMTLETVMQEAALEKTSLRLGLAQLERVGAIERLPAEAHLVHARVRSLGEAQLEAIQAHVAQWRTHKLAQLHKMIVYAETTDRCRQQMLLEHFGETNPVRAHPCCDYHIRLARNEMRPSARPQPTPPAPEKSAEASLEATYVLLRQGLSVSQVAQQRGLMLNTVYAQAARLIAEGRLALRAVVSETIELQVRHAIAQVGSTETLAAIKAQLPEEVDYGVIRCVLAQMQRERSP